jgi:acetyl esterase/lipase
VPADPVILTLALLFILALVVWAVARFPLRGVDLSAFDLPPGTNMSRAGPPSAGHRDVVAWLGNVPRLLQGVPRKRHLAVLRDYVDNAFPDGGKLATFAPVDAGGIAAEWVLAQDADPDRRMLYLHGGAFAMGSPKSHRRITSKMSEVARAAVLAIDYRLMPEHPRTAGIEDSRTAYRWMLEHGPAGPRPAAAAFVAGDSAGGNLALSLIAWLRDHGLRAPDAAVALSPVTDSTMGSPSLRTNIATDPMLGPLFGPLKKVPRTLLLWFGWLQIRINPRDPLVSPVYGDLSRLPPVLVHASNAEMLRDDARRYVNRAVAAGSPATLQTWDHMVHVWHIFHPDLPEGRDAFEEIRRFFTQHGPGPAMHDHAAVRPVEAADAPGRY